MTVELVIGELVKPSSLPKGASIQERFAAFHTANPWVANALERLVIDLLARGRRRVGMKMLFEVLRWQYVRQTIAGDFKLNNVFTSRYVRLLLESHPEWVGVFELRELRA